MHRRRVEIFFLMISPLPNFVHNAGNLKIACFIFCQFEWISWLLINSVLTLVVLHLFTMRGCRLSWTRTQVLTCRNVIFIKPDRESSLNLGLPHVLLLISLWWWTYRPPIWTWTEISWILLQPFKPQCTLLQLLSSSTRILIHGIDPVFRGTTHECRPPGRNSRMLLSNAIYCNSVGRNAPTENTAVVCQYTCRAELHAATRGLN